MVKGFYHDRGLCAFSIHELFRLRLAEDTNGKMRLTISLRAQIESAAARLRELNEAITRGSVKRDDAWADACKEFHQSYDALAFPGGLDNEISGLKSGDASSIEMAVTFLEVDAMFFRSGYIKEELLTRLKNADLTSSQVQRLSAAILNVVDDRDCREFRRYCQLGPVNTNEVLR